MDVSYQLLFNGPEESDVREQIDAFPRCPTNHMTCHIIIVLPDFRYRTSGLLCYTYGLRRDHF